jgi:hypothetical protein
MGEQTLDLLEEKDREIRGLQEMLYLVLNEVGEPVTVTDEIIKAGIVGDKMIDITQNEEDKTWTFRIVDIQKEILDAVE